MFLGCCKIGIPLPGTSYISKNILCSYQTLPEATFFNRVMKFDISLCLEQMNWYVVVVKPKSLRQIFRTNWHQRGIYGQLQMQVTRMLLRLENNRQTMQTTYMARID